MSRTVRAALIGTATATVALALAHAPVAATAPEDDAASAGDPIAIAEQHVNDNAEDLGVSRADVADLEVASAYPSSHSGVTHVNLNQRFQGLEVFGAYATVNVAPDGRVLFVGDSLVKGLRVAGPSEPDVDPAKAVEEAAESLELDEPTDLRVIRTSSGAAQETVLSDGGISDAPIPARLGWQPTADGLRLAWQLVIDDSSDEHLWNATVDAETGELLDVDDWTISHNEEELASTLARGNTATHETASTAATGTHRPANPVMDGSSYTVYEVPSESPNDGPRTTVTNPADADASPFGWHDTDGAAGAEFTTTRGNNVHAYLDQDNNNQPDFGQDVDGGPGLQFNFDADLTEHAQAYRDAVVTNLFYMNNVVHDVMYGYGFDEVSGNFQANKYGATLQNGNPVPGGDYVRAEAADGGGTNNANFSTPANYGGTPRMQMYLWPGTQFGMPNVVTAGNSTFTANFARFGPPATNAGVGGEVVVAGNGCTADQYPDPLPTGAWIAVVDGVTAGAGCAHPVRTGMAESLGASAVIIASTTATAAILTGAQTGPPNPVGIPAVSVSLADGNALKAVAGDTAAVAKNPNHPGIRDGDFENGIIIHEYGHGISLRLTGGPGVNCLSGTEQMGEGWSDYYAITMLLDPDLDDPEAGRGMGPYALFEDDRHGAGIRPRPYSRDMAIQPFTYDSTKTGGWLNGASLAAPHGVGHGWAAVLWDVTWDLIDKHGFNPNIYDDWDAGGNNRALQYVTDGLKFQGCAPGFVVARDAIIEAADFLSDGEDTCTLWASFARRGLGYSAEQGTTARDDNTEAFDTHPDCQVGFEGSVSNQPAINSVKRGTVVPLVFSVGGNQGLDILVENSPYSRQVDCNTLATVDPTSPFITPRPLPVPTVTPARAGLSYDRKEDRYTYPWQTLTEWAGTCREVVITRTDGIQHRAYFRFDATPAQPVSGHVRDSVGNPVANATVRIEETAIQPVVTDADGFYSFDAVPKGTYDATATAAGCNAPQTRTLTVSGPTTLDFTLPERSDEFGYTCRSEDLPFAEAETVLAISGDDVSAPIDLPFPFTFYGETYTEARVCTNGYLEFGPVTASCVFTNAAIPTTARPNGAVYPYWDDLFVDAEASIRTSEVGASPNRQFVIEFRNMRYFGDTSRRIDFNIVLHENGTVITQHRNLADDGRERGNSATLGIENHTGTVALRYSFNEPVLPVEPAVGSIRYTPPS